MGSSKALFLQMQPNFVSHLKIMWHPMSIMSFLVLGIGLLQDAVNLLVDVLNAFNKYGFLISLRQYMCVFCLCSHMRHGNINQTLSLKSQTHFKGTVTSRDMEKSVIIVLLIGMSLIPCSWMLGVVHAEYVNYHHVDELCLAVSLGIECSRHGELGLQYCPEA